MSITPEQAQELDKYQNKFLNGEITAKEYEFAKAEILKWEHKEPQKIHKIRADESSENIDDDPVIGNAIYVFVAFIFTMLGGIVKNTVIGVKLATHFLHKKVQAFSKKKQLPLWGIYGVLIGIVFIFMIGDILYINYTESAKNAEEKILQDKKMADIKAEQERVEKEKANTPKPIIEIQSSQGSQGNKTTYLLKFTASGADSIKMNGENISINGSGVYEKEIPLENIETAISLTAKNKYYSTENAFLITRDKNTNDVAKEEKAKKDAEKKKQAEEKARIQALNDTFKKNCIDPTGTSWELDYYLRKVVLKDPDSYERINTYFKDEGDVFNVFIKYRAKNSYGGYVIELAGAKVGQDCKLIDYLGSVNPDTLDL